MQQSRGDSRVLAATLRASVALALAVLTACEPASRPDDARGADVARLIREASCDAQLEPGCPPPDVDRQGCSARSAVLFYRGARAVDEGLADIDEAALDRCLAALECDWIPPWCASVFRGRLPAGGACAHDVECTPSLFCDRAADALCGACVAALPPDAVCTRSAACAAGTDEDPSEQRVCLQPSFFEPGVCGTRETRVGEVGGACGIVIASAGREIETRCPAPAVCTRVGDSGMCLVVPASEGEPCAPGFSLCAEGLSCWLGACRRAVGEGERCTEDAPTDPVVCDRREGLACVFELCEPVPDEPGDACPSGAGCGQGLMCVGGLCAEPAHEGGPCTADIHCRSGACSGAGVCEPPSTCGPS